MPEDDGYRGPILLEVDRIDPDPAASVREKHEEEHIVRYMENFPEISKKSPICVVVGKKGPVDHWLSDGWYRVQAAKRLGITMIPVLFKNGDYLTALRDACVANDAHGVVSTAGDKRRRVEVTIKRPEAKGMTQQEIAEVCGVTQSYVSQIRSKGGSGLITVISPDQPPAKDSRTHVERQAEVEASLKQDAGQTNTAISEACRVSVRYVAKVRDGLGLPASPAGGRKGGRKKGGKARAGQEAKEPATPLPQPESNGPPPAAGMLFDAGTGVDTEPERDEEEDPFPELEWEKLWKVTEEEIHARYEQCPKEDRSSFASNIEMMGNTLLHSLPGIQFDVLLQRKDDDERA